MKVESMAAKSISDRLVLAKLEPFRIILGVQSDCESRACKE